MLNLEGFGLLISLNYYIAV